MGDTNQDTPARYIGVRGLTLNRRAMEDCLTGIRAGAVGTVLDIRYGTGGWAKAVVKTLRPTEYVGYEWDAPTARASWCDPPVTLHAERWTPASPRPASVDLLLADFNMTTAKARGLLDEAVVAVTPAYIIFTDVAAAKLHLNFRSYGLVEPSLAAYWAAFALGGYSLVKFSRHQHPASTALFERKNPGDDRG